MEESTNSIVIYFKVFVSIFGFVFVFWPLILVNVLRGRRKILEPILIMWTVLAVMKALTLFYPELRSLSFIIPEPLNTVLFLLTGGLLLAIFLGRRIWQAQKFQGKIGTVKTIDHLLNLSPTEFEKMVVELYQANGHKAKRTGQIGDHGVDVVVQTKNGEKWIAQCKRWRGQVGEPVIRDFYGTMHHEKADKGAIIAIGGFSKQAKDWAKGKPIYLYDGQQFLKAWNKTQNRKDRNTTQAQKAS